MQLTWIMEEATITVCPSTFSSFYFLQIRFRWGKIPAIICTLNRMSVCMRASANLGTVTLARSLKLIRVCSRNWNLRRILINLSCFKLLSWLWYRSWNLLLSTNLVNNNLLSLILTSYDSEITSYNSSLWGARGDDWGGTRKFNLFGQFKDFGV